MLKSPHKDRIAPGNTEINLDPRLQMDGRTPLNRGGDVL
jgi:hypothetical protein